MEEKSQVLTRNRRVGGVETAAFQSQTAVQQDNGTTCWGRAVRGHGWCGPPHSRAVAFPALKSRAQITFSHRCNSLRFWKLRRTWKSVTQVTARTNREGVWFLPGPNSCYMLGMGSCLNFLLKQQSSVKAPFAAGKVMLTKVLQSYPTDLGPTKLSHRREHCQAILQSWALQGQGWLLWSKHLTWEPGTEGARVVTFSEPLLLSHQLLL